jgi:hypothetical protein
MTWPSTYAAHQAVSSAKCPNCCHMLPLTLTKSQMPQSLFNLCLSQEVWQSPATSTNTISHDVFYNILRHLVAYNYICGPKLVLLPGVVVDCEPNWKMLKVLDSSRFGRCLLYLIE